MLVAPSFTQYRHLSDDTKSRIDQVRRGREQTSPLGKFNPFIACEQRIGWLLYRARRPCASLYVRRRVQFGPSPALLGSRLARFRSRVMGARPMDSG